MADPGPLGPRPILQLLASSLLLLLSSCALLPEALFPLPAEPTPSSTLPLDAAPYPLPTSGGGLPAQETLPPTQPGPDLPKDLPVRPGPLPSSTSRAGVASTPTPAASPTTDAVEQLPSPSPSASLTPTTAPQLQQVSDLLFITEGRLQRWNPLTQKVSLVTTGVVDFAVSQQVPHIALLRGHQATAGERNTFDLSLLDLETGRSTELVEAGERIYGLKLSPDGRQVSYTSQPGGGTIFTIAAQAGSQPLNMGDCAANMELVCTSPVAWRWDSRALAWSDERGVWVSELPAGQVLLAVPAEIEIPDPKGQTTRLTVRFSDLKWSPHGRYLLASIQPVNSDGRLSPVQWQGLLDVRTGRVAEVPGSYSTATPPASSTWLLDGRLLAVYAGGENSLASPIASLWLLRPTRADLLLLEGSLVLDEPALPADAGRAYTPAWTAALGEQLVSFALVPKDEDQPSILYVLDLKLGQVAKINSVPGGIREVRWAPDQSGALVFSGTGETLFLPADQRKAVKLDPLFGVEAHGFTWLPPADRSPVEPGTPGG